MNNDNNRFEMYIYVIHLFIYFPVNIHDLHKTLQNVLPNAKNQRGDIRYKFIDKIFRTSI